MKKILLIYASKTGTTKDAASEVAKNLSVPCDIYDCRDKLLNLRDQTQVSIKPDELNWGNYEIIIIGTAMYMGSPLKEIKLICKKQREKLTQKRLVFFTCGIGTQEEDKAYLWKHLPEDVSQSVLLYCHLGGEIREDRLNAFSRFAMREYVKQQGPALGINFGVIKEFSTEIVKLMK